jgi:hypothetical protein
MCDFIDRCADSKFVPCKQKVVPNGFSGFPYCYKPLTTDSADGAEVALDCGVKLPLKIVNIRRGKREKQKYIYAALRDNEDTLLISATVDYILERLPEILKAT